MEPRRQLIVVVGGGEGSKSYFDHIHKLLSEQGPTLCFRAPRPDEPQCDPMTPGRSARDRQVRHLPDYKRDTGITQQYIRNTLRDWRKNEKGKYLWAFIEPANDMVQNMFIQLKAWAVTEDVMSKKSGHIVRNIVIICSAPDHGNVRQHYGQQLHTYLINHARTQNISHTVLSASNFGLAQHAYEPLGYVIDREDLFTDVHHGEATSPHQRIRDLRVKLGRDEVPMVGMFRPITPPQSARSPLNLSSPPSPQTGSPEHPFVLDSLTAAHRRRRTRRRKTTGTKRIRRVFKKKKRTTTTASRRRNMAARRKSY